MSPEALQRHIKWDEYSLISQNMSDLLKFVSRLFLLDVIGMEIDEKRYKRKKVQEHKRTYWKKYKILVVNSLRDLSCLATSKTCFTWGEILIFLQLNTGYTEAWRLINFRKVL